MTATLSRPLPVEIAPPLRGEPRAPRDVSARAEWIDAFRGFVMFSLISRSFGFTRFALQKPFKNWSMWPFGPLVDSARQIDSVREGIVQAWPFRWALPVVNAFDHVEWVGITPWDMIQPFFTFIVGVAMPYAYAKRAAAGESRGRQFGHAVKRSLVLLFLAHFSQSASSGKPVVELINVLAQIGLAYMIAFLVLGRSWKVQAGVALGLLALHTGVHFLWHPPGVTGPWVKEANVGWYLDKTILHKNWSGGYATINFVTSCANMIAGVMAGELMRREIATARRGPDWKRVGMLVGIGVALFLAGRSMSPWVPVVKRIWTSSFALISIGISLWTLAGFYIVGRLWPSVPWKLFIVCGANPIFLYLASIMFGGHLRKIVGTYTEWTSRFAQEQWHASRITADAWTQFAMDWIVLGFLVYLAFWLYRRKIFIRV